MSDIRLYLISGFLGAGKTTLLQRILRGGRPRTGVLVNDFGKIDVDGAIIGSDELPMIQIGNGSIFCSCLKGQFIEALIRFSHLDIDELFIESSGLSDPSQIRDILDKIVGHLARPYDYKGSICLVDCDTFLDYVDVLVALEHQVAASDLVLLSKTDLVEEGTVSEVENRVRSISPNAKILRTTYAQVPLEYLPGSPVEKSGARACVNTVQSRPGSYLLRMPGTCTRERLLAAATAMAPHVLRLKGFALSEDGPVLVEVAGHRASVRPAAPQSAIAGTKLVILSTEPDAKTLFARIWKQSTGAIARIY